MREASREELLERLAEAEARLSLAEEVVAKARIVSEKMFVCKPDYPDTGGLRGLKEALSRWDKEPSHEQT